MRSIVTAPAIVVRGGTYAITRRTTFRKAFLAPWDPRVEQCWLYAMAHAQLATSVAVHHGVRVVSHHHVSFTPRQPNAPEFLHRFHHDTSCAINVLLAEQRYDQPRNVFDKRSTHRMRLLDAAAQASQITYEHLNPSAAGLVTRPEHMPGTVMDWGHWKSGGIAVKRPDVYFGKNRPEELWLELTPPPLLMLAFDGDLEALVHHMRRLTEHGIRELRIARGNRPPLGAQKLQRMHPWNEPKTLAEPGGRLVPTFKIGARGFVGKRIRCEAAVEVTGFQGDYKESRLQWLGGRRDVSFPHGTYSMRVLHGANVAEPSPGAIVAQPGPLLEELEYGTTDARMHVIEEVRAAWREEAAEVALVDELDFASRIDSPRTSVTKAANVGDAEPLDSNVTGDEAAPPEREQRPAPEVRHRFHRERGDGGTHPRRLVVERDRRRGRPAKPKRDADPPS